MKCKYCDGTGTSNWCINGIFQPCEYCNGTGEVEVVGDSVTDVCDKCGETGFCEMRTGDVCTLGSPCPHQKPLTNEEWFCGLSTAEKAKWMAKHMSFCEVCEIQTCRGDGCQRFDRGSMTETDAFREWLKEKHI